jgi:purine nucleosidase
LATDPAAAVGVFAAGFDLDLIALDITMKTVATGAWLDRLKEVPGDRAQNTSAFLDFYAEFYKGIFGVRQCAMHDPLAAAVLVDPHLVTGAFDAPIRVELNGALTRGMTVADRRLRPGGDERRAARVITEVSEDEFLDRMLDALR